MADIRVHVFHTGEVCVAPALPFGGAHCSTLKASGVFDKRSERIWLPVSAYLITCPHGKILFDCGWHRDMSPDGRFVLLFSDGGYASRSWKELIVSGIADDKAAQLRSLEWIRTQSMDANCIESSANHDPDVKPHIIEL